MAIKAQRITRRSTAERTWEKQDELEHATSKAVSFAQTNRRALIIGGVTTVLVIFGLIGLTYHLEDRAARRSSAFSEGLEHATAAVVPKKVEEPGEAAAALEPAPEAEESEDFNSYPERAAKARASYQAFLGQWGTGGDLGVMAQMSTAGLALEEGKHKDALAAFGALAQRSDLKTSMRLFALDGQAQAQEAAGDGAAAAASYLQIAALEAGLYADYAAVQRGRLAEQAGKKDEALQIYKEALERSPKSRYQDELTKRLEVLGASAPAS